MGHAQPDRLPGDRGRRDRSLARGELIGAYSSGLDRPVPAPGPAPGWVGRTARRGLRMAVVWVAVCGEPGADLIGFGGAEARVQGEGLLPVAAGLAGVACGVVGAGE